MFQGCSWLFSPGIGHGDMWNLIGISVLKAETKLTSKDENFFMYIFLKVFFMRQVAQLESRTVVINMQMYTNYCYLF